MFDNPKFNRTDVASDQSTGCSEVGYNYEEIRRRLERGPRMTSLCAYFERIAAGEILRPSHRVIANDGFLARSEQHISYHETLQRACGTFLQHGCASIPFLMEEIVRVGIALHRYAHHRTPENSIFNYYESSSADGTVARTLAEYSAGKILTLTDSPNEANEREFKKLNRTPYAEFHRGCFADITPEFLDAKFPQFRDGFDLIWENTTFQMYGNRRDEQIAYIKRVLKSTGVMLFLEKMQHASAPEYRRREEIKDSLFKARYFDRPAIVAKKEAILEVMESGQCGLEEFLTAVNEHFRHVALIWNSSNFYHIAASNDEISFGCFLECLGDPFVPAEFSHYPPQIFKSGMGDTHRAYSYQDNLAHLRLPPKGRSGTALHQPLVELVCDSSRSIAQLKDLFADGYSVVRSAHAGNLSAANIIVAESGLPILLHELLPINDKSYRPGVCLVGNEEIPLTIKRDGLALFAQTDVFDTDNDGWSPIHYHVNAITDRWPNAQCLHQFVLSIGEELVSNLLERFFAVDSEVAHAFVDNDGNAHSVSKSAMKIGPSSDTVSLLREHFSSVGAAFRFNRAPCQTVIPDVVTMIVLVTIADILNPERRYMREDEDLAHVYHLAGAKMFDYLINNSKEGEKYAFRINRLYAEARRVIPVLPQRVIFHLVPTQYLDQLVTHGGLENLRNAVTDRHCLRIVEEKINSMKGLLLNPHRAVIDSFSDWSHICEYVRLHASLGEVVPLGEGNFSHSEFLRNPERFKGRLLGKLAMIESSAELLALEETAKALKSCLRVAAQNGGMQVKSISHYDLSIPNSVGDLYAEIKPLLHYNEREVKNSLAAIRRFAR
jgi:SAM-dependent methyltransferase